MLGLLRKFQQLHGVGVQLAGKHHEGVEAVHAGKDAREGCGVDADVDDGGREAVEGVEVYGVGVNMLIFQKRQEFVEVAHVGLDGVVGESFLQLQVLVVSASEFLHEELSEKQFQFTRIWKEAGKLELPCFVSIGCRSVDQVISVSP